MTRYSAIAFILLVAGSAQAAERKLDRTFTVTPGGTLTVEADGGTVRVTGSDSNQVIVHMLFRGADDDLANIQPDAVQKADGVAVTVLNSKSKHSWFSWFSWRSDVSIDVTVPHRYNIDVHTGGGSVELTDTIGNASLRTSGGEVSATNVTGNVQARTSGGSIHVDTIRGDIDADTSGGGVELLHVDGKIRGNTSGGSVNVSLVGANRGISATTSGGGIELILPPGTKGAVDISTSGGGVHSDIPVTSTVNKDHQIVGTINGGGEAIYAHTSGGSVSLRKAD